MKILDLIAASSVSFCIASAIDRPDSSLLPASSPSGAGTFSKIVYVTSYSNKYQGRHTRSGEVFDQKKLTCAVPRSKWNELNGKFITFGYGNRRVSVKVNDTCGPNVNNYDLSRFAWDTLIGFAPGRCKVRIMKVTE